MKIYFFLLITLCTTATPLWAQKLHWFISPTTNLYIPIHASAKGTYPILWYDKQTSPKILIGGFGIGVSAYKDLKENWKAKGLMNCSKATYWNAPITIFGVDGVPYRSYTTSTSEYALGMTASVHYQVRGPFWIGSGLGSRYMFISFERLPEGFGGGGLRNYSQRNFSFTIPLEISLMWEKFTIATRYEQGLSNRLKKGATGKERFGVLFFDIGFRLRS